MKIKMLKSRRILSLDSEARRAETICKTQLIFNIKRAVNKTNKVSLMLLFHESIRFKKIVVSLFEQMTLTIMN